MENNSHKDLENITEKEKVEPQILRIGTIVSIET